MLEAYQVARLRIEMSKSPVGTDSACLVGYFGVKGGGFTVRGPGQRVCTWGKHSA